MMYGPICYSVVLVMDVLPPGFLMAREGQDRGAESVRSPGVIARPNWKSIAAPRGAAGSGSGLDHEFDSGNPSGNTRDHEGKRQAGADGQAACAFPTAPPHYAA